MILPSNKEEHCEGHSRSKHNIPLVTKKFINEVMQTNDVDDRVLKKLFEKLFNNENILEEFS